MRNSAAVFCCFELGTLRRAEADGLQRELRDCFRTLEGEQGPVTHIQSSQRVCVCVCMCACVCVCVSGRANERARVRVRTSVRVFPGTLYVRVYIHLPRKCSQRRRLRGHFSPAAVCVCVGLCEDTVRFLLFFFSLSLPPFSLSLSLSLSRVVCGPTVIF